MKKGFILGFVCALLLATGFAFANEMLSEVYTSQFPIKINGKDYTPEMPVLNYQGRTYLALREFGTATENTIDFVDNTIIINTKGYVAPSSNTTTLGQKNALASAKSYLSFSSFSRKGLMDQLKYEGFSDEEAKYAVDNCGADWNEQAAKSAQGYLDFSSFSRKGLIEQLEFEGFTSEQAEYGVSSVGY